MPPVVVFAAAVAPSTVIATQEIFEKLHDVRPH